MCTEEQHIEKMKAFGRIEHALQTLIDGRPAQSYNAAISDTQGFHLDYKCRRHVFIYSNIPIALAQASNTFPIFQETWTNIDHFSEGHKLFTVGTASPVNVKIHATDDMIA